MAVLPAGFGESLILQIFVFYWDAKTRTVFASIIVICLLKSEIQDQSAEVTSKGMSV